MKKNILVALFLSVILFVGAKAFIALFSYQTAEKLKQSVEHEFAVTYSWISSELDGSIVFHDLSVTPYRLKRTFYIDRLRINYGSYLNLLLNLTNLAKGRHDGLESIAAQSITGELSGRDIEEWISLEYGDEFSKPLGVYACGNQTRASHDNLREMGIHEYQSSFTLKKTETIDLDAVGLSLMLDRGALGETNLTTIWEGASVPNELSQFKVEDLQLKALSLTHIDNGYFRRLSNFCSKHTQFDRTQFSQNASTQWQESMRLIGLEVSDGVKSLYSDYLLQGGQLKLKLAPTKSFAFNRFESLLDQDIISYFGVSAKLNGAAMPSSTLKVMGKHFKPPVVVKVDENKEENLNLDLPKTGFLSIPLDELEQSAQKRVRVDMKDGKKYEGLVDAVNKQKIELSQQLAGGTVVYVLKREQIERVEMWH